MVALQDEQLWRVEALVPRKALQDKIAARGETLEWAGVIHDLKEVEASRGTAAALGKA